MTFWAISRLLTDIYYAPFTEGTLGSVVCYGKALIYDGFLLHFLFVKVRQAVADALKEERRFYERLDYYRQITLTVLANNIKLIADTVNHSQKGFMLVLSKHLKRCAKKGMIVSIEKELYKIVWTHTKGMQYQIGLQKQ